MNMTETMGRVQKLSDGELVEGLTSVLGASRRLVAVVLVHLAEVEERRLHLLAGYSSLFAYCTVRLAMSEDEAYRRIRVAALARRFPGVLERLASGQLSLSVAALVEPHLTAANRDGLLAAVAGKTVKQAREVLATWLPQPDVLPHIRKLPERSAHVASPCAGSPPLAADARGELAGDVVETTLAAPVHAKTSSARVPEPDPERPAATGEAAGQATAPRQAPTPVRSHRPASTIEPLSFARYEVAFTADADLKRKLDLARDLLRHAVPQGDLAAIVDHIDPHGQGGTDDAANIRHRCRAHNRLTAEQTYGKHTITRIIADRRGRHARS